MQRRKNTTPTSLEMIGAFANDSPTDSPYRTQSLSSNTQQDNSTDGLINEQNVTRGSTLERGSQSFPNLREIMVDDYEYRSFLLEEQGGSKNEDFHSDVACAKFCTGLSVIAMVFLVLVGVLIETQPLYIKGIKPKKFNQDEMQDEAKTAFKTATAYFLTMVLSIIYTHNREQFKWDILLRIKNAIHLRQHFAVAYNSYRRQRYRDIPEDFDSIVPDLPRFEDILKLRDDGNLGLGVETDCFDDHVPSFELWKRVHHLGKNSDDKAKQR